MLSGCSGTLGPYQRPAASRAAGRPGCAVMTGAVNLTTPNGRRPGDGGGGGGTVLTPGQRGHGRPVLHLGPELRHSENGFLSHTAVFRYARDLRHRCGFAPPHSAVQPHAPV
ncbi:hypothetical protein GCM10010359_35880 [Streptomyces morookaense]|nr:hypothetical protein GCM10010359_35880 [Streptomyces morookaense]